VGRQIKELPPDIAGLLRRGGGVLLLADAAAASIAASRIDRLVRAGLLTAMARGCLVTTAKLRRLDAWQLHREKARAFALASRQEVYVTGWAAVMFWKLRTVGRPPRLPTLIVPRQPGRGHGSSTPNGRTLLAALPTEHRYRMPAGSRRWGVVSKSWAAADVARQAPVPDALIVADSAVRDGANVASALACMRLRAGYSRALWVAEHADPNAESALETVGRFTCIQHDLPLPVSNAWVGADGPEFRVDHLWPYHWVAGEGDGAQKYNDRSDAAAIVQAQNDREFRLRRLGLDLLRYGWSDAYYQRSELAKKFAALLAAHPPREKPIRWWKHVPGKGPGEPKREDWPSPYPLGIVLPAGWDLEQDPLRIWPDDDLDDEPDDEF
jgi:hypothetical protein